MVSDYGSEQRIPSAETTEEDLKNYAERTGLTAASPAEHMGGWRFQGTDYLDKSRRYPNESTGRAAMAFQNQQSMFDASKKPEDPGAYIDNPGYEEGYTEEKGIQRGAVIPTWLRPAPLRAPTLRTVQRPS